MATLVTLTAAQKLSIRRDLGLVNEGAEPNPFYFREFKPSLNMSASTMAVYLLEKISDYMEDLLEHSDTLERETK